MLKTHSAILFFLLFSISTQAAHTMTITRNNHAELGEPVGPYTHCLSF